MRSSGGKGSIDLPSRVLYPRPSLTPSQNASCCGLGELDDIERMNVNWGKDVYIPQFSSFEKYDSSSKMFRIVLGVCHEWRGKLRNSATKQSPAHVN